MLASTSWIFHFDVENFNASNKIDGHNPSPIAILRVNNISLRFAEAFYIAGIIFLLHIRDIMSVKACHIPNNIIAIPFIYRTSKFTSDSYSIIAASTSYYVGNTRYTID